jgi:hypothetical protein
MRSKLGIRCKAQGISFKTHWFPKCKTCISISLGNREFLSGSGSFSGRAVDFGPSQKGVDRVGAKRVTPLTVLIVATRGRSQISRFHALPQRFHCVCQSYDFSTAPTRWMKANIVNRTILGVNYRSWQPWENQPKRKALHSI